MERPRRRARRPAPAGELGHAWRGRADRGAHRLVALPGSRPARRARAQRARAIGRRRPVLRAASALGAPVARGTARAGAGEELVAHAIAGGGAHAPASWGSASNAQTIRPNARRGVSRRPAGAHSRHRRSAPWIPRILLATTGRRLHIPSATVTPKPSAML